MTEMFRINKEQSDLFADGITLLRELQTCLDECNELDRRPRWRYWHGRIDQLLGESEADE